MTQITDEELDRLLTEAGRARTPLDAKPDAEAMALLERIMATDPHPHRRRNRVLGWVTASGAAVAAAVVGIGMIVSPAAAVAGTPQPLEFAGEATVQQTISEAQTASLSASGPAEPERFVQSATWSYDIAVDEGSAVIVPQLVTLQWEADQSGRVTVVDGEAYDPSDAVANVSAEVSSSGRVSMDLVMEPGDFATPVAGAPGATAAELTASLAAFGMPAEPTAFEVVSATASLLEQWTLTNLQQSELLNIIAGADGATALGTTTDRLDREVAGLRVVSADGAAADVLLISADTGRIVGIERTNVKADGVLPAGAVIGYRLFDLPADVLG